MTDVTAQFARYAATIRHQDLPPEVETRARFLILDLVGNMIR
ncbi:MAG: MmgE/PrpD family protein, partial [Rubritepida sp.]|nr:MmgE/PrpD family protein [Rubritepida sp.]